MTSRSPTILMVDDDPDLRALVEMVMGVGGCEVLSAADGRAALGLARSGRPTVALLDVMLPGALDGLAVCRRLKAELPDCYVIIVSGRSLESDVLDAELAGADAYFVKPISLFELHGLVDSILRGRDGVRHAPRRDGQLRPFAPRG